MTTPQLRMTRDYRFATEIDAEVAVVAVVLDPRKHNLTT
jgi:hypothetical protein